MSALLLALLAAAAPAPRSYFPPSYRKPEWVCRFEDGESPALAIVDETTDAFLSEIFRDAAEPSLYRASLRTRRNGEETLRFTWAGTGHTPVTVRVEIGGGKARLIAKQLSQHDRHSRAEVERDVDRPLTAAETAALRAHLAATHVFDRDVPSCDVVIDGSIWVLERVDARGYHLAQRWIPGEGEHRALSLFLLGLTGWGIKPVA